METMLILVTFIVHLKIKNMEINLGNISVIYPNENSPQARKITLTPDGEFLQINIFDDTLNSVGITLEKHELELLSDSLKLILKNKLVEELA